MSIFIILGKKYQIVLAGTVGTHVIVAFVNLDYKTLEKKTVKDRTGDSQKNWY